MKKTLALTLALMMVLCLFTACGGAGSVKGAEQSSSKITAFVPEGFEFSEGSIMDPSDANAVSITDPNSLFTYFNIAVTDTDNAMSNIDLTKSMNESYGPTDVTDFAAGENKWNGIAYNADGVACFFLYSEIGGEVYTVMGAGNAYDSDTAVAVLSSVKAAQ